MRQLLEKGAAVETKGGFRTLLLLAAENRHEAVVRQLLEKGAVVEAMDRLG